MCNHNNLVSDGSYTGTFITCNGTLDMPDYFSYKKYICQDCGREVIILQAIVEKREATDVIKTTEKQD